MTKPLKAKHGLNYGYPLQPGEVVVLFYRDGTAFYPCVVATAMGRDLTYLASLVRFMQHKVPG